MIELVIVWYLGIGCAAALVNLVRTRIKKEYNSALFADTATFLFLWPVLVVVVIILAIITALTKRR